MTSDLVIQLFSQLLWNAALIAAPVLLVTLVVGLVVSVLQVVTQIQEMSLTFVPKIVTVVATLILFDPWMLRKLLAYSSGVISNIPAYF